MKSRHAILAAAYVTALMLTGCSSSSGEKQVLLPTSSAVPQPPSAAARPSQSCQALVEAKRLRAALSSAFLGDELSFQVARDQINTLQVFAAAKGLLLESVTRHTNAFLAKKDVVLKVKYATDSIRLLSPELLAAAKVVTATEMLDKPPPQRIAATEAMEMLSQRIGKSASELVSLKGIDPESIFLLRKDTEVFQRLLAGMHGGDAEFRLRPAKAPASRNSLSALRSKFGPVKEQVGIVLANFADLVAAREAQAKALIDVEALDRALSPECLPQ